MCGSIKYPYLPKRERKGGGSRVKVFKGKYDKTGISRGVEGSDPNNLLWEGFKHFLEEHNKLKG